MIHCADCLHCKTFWGVMPVTPKGYKEFRVRCDKGRWLTSWGSVKTFSHHTVLNRQMESCDDYSAMSEGGSPEEIQTDHAAFLKDLQFNLPVTKQLREVV